MTKRSEQRKIEKFKQRLDEQIRPVEKHLKWLKKMIKKAINWYWFNNSKSDGSKALHIIMWLIVTVGLIGWYRIAFGN
jgi:uncharacterized membrane-anchored protein YhcB (DUF1043 family)